MKYELYSRTHKLSSKIATKLDAISTFLEAKGYIKEAHEVDKISNLIEKVSAVGLPVGTRKLGPEEYCPICSSDPGYQAYHEVAPVNSSMGQEMIKDIRFPVPSSITKILSSHYGSIIDDDYMLLTEEQAKKIPGKICNACLEKAMKGMTIIGLEWPEGKISGKAKKITFDHGIEKEGWPGEGAPHAPGL
jgi:hypothetical protein